MIHLNQVSLALALLLTLWMAGFSLFISSSLNIRPSETTAQSDSIIVLTGGKMRIEEGLKLFSLGKAPELFITGVHPDSTLADITARYDGEAPLPACCITIEQEAVTTIGNAAHTVPWIQKKNMTQAHLVTSNYHFMRAKLEFQALMPELDIVPHTVEPPAGSYEDRIFWQLMMEEYHKYLFRYTQLMLKGVGAS